MKEIKRKLALILTVYMVLNTAISAYAEEITAVEDPVLGQQMILEDTPVIAEAEKTEIMQTQQEIFLKNTEEVPPANADCNELKSDAIYWAINSAGKLTISLDSTLSGDGVKQGSFSNAEKFIKIEEDDSILTTPWYDYHDSIKTVVIDDSEGKVAPEHTDWWFGDCINVTSIDLSGLDASNITSMDRMFDNCKSITSLSLAGLDIINNTSMGGLFAGCIALTTIYVSDDWDNSKISGDSSKMFFDCISLEGEEGTRYTEKGSDDKTYARIDGKDYQEGYFTESMVCTVTLDPQGGSGGTDKVTAAGGSPMPKATMPRRSSYTFAGYFDATSSEGTKYYNADGSSAKAWDKKTDSTLYARWNSNHPEIEVLIDAPYGYKKKLLTLDGDFISQNEETFHVLVGSTTEKNQQAVLDALSQYYDSTSDIPVRLVHKDFVDAEKWNADPDIDPFDEGLQDSLLCWAASLSGMLWSSGWAQSVKNPETQEPMFSSEDEVFTWFSCYPPSAPNFFNMGGEADKGIDWFFDGSYLASGFRNSPWSITDDNEGWFRELMAECLYEKVSIVDAPQELEIMERLSADSKMPAFTASVGSLYMGAAAVSEHSMTAMGLIINPEESEASERYKAIILADPDNDGIPSIDIESSDEERIADRSDRPNSYTVYPLRLITDSQGKKCWQIVGLSDETTILYELIYLSAMAEESMEKALETEGTKDVYKNSDFLFGEGITSNDPPVSPTSKDESVSEFQTGEDIYFIFELFEKGVYSDEKNADIKIRLALTRNSMPFTEEIRTLNVMFPFAPIDMKEYLKLNENYNLTPGRYTLTAEINPELNGEQRYPESYYRNNKPLKLEFSVIGKQDPTPHRSSANGTAKPLFTGTWNNPVSNGKWTLDAKGIWHYTTNAMFKSTWGYIVNPYAQNRPDWFWFDDRGDMLIGWQFINGKWYYLNPMNDGTLGACQLGGKTPDGYTLNADGSWAGY